MRTVLATLLCLWVLPGLADERILLFDSDIQVHANGSMSVTETIRVRAQGREIKRGIYRDFPTSYKTASGRRHKVDFHIVGVQRDGQPEAWHTARQSNGIRVYFGRREVMLEPGIYEYRFSYTTKRQLGYFDRHDELYWNVTGHGWAFPIELATARVQLPESTARSELQGTAYTGAYGAGGSNWRWEALDSGALYATTTRLAPREGLTIVLQWPKGLVAEPSRQDRLRWYWQDNTGLVIMWGGSLLILLYYLFAWLRVGRDPPAGVILPEYDPPEGYSPAAMRLIRRMDYDDKCLSAALVSQAVQGNLTIRERDDEYSVHRDSEGTPPGEGDEQAVLDRVGSSLTFSRSNHVKVRNLIETHKQTLVNRYRRHYYYANRGWFFPGLFMSIAVIGAAGWGLFQSYGPEAIFILFMAVFVAAFGAPFLIQLWRMRHGYRRGAGDWVRLFASGVPLLFLGSMFVGADFADMLNFMPWQVVTGAMVLIVINVAFNYLIKAPTRRGRNLLDRIEGFRQYLSLAEGDELKLRYAKPVTPELFEAYLPYAIALDVETQWSERFANDLRAAGESPGDYHGRWYDGNDFRGARGIATSVSSSLAASVSAASSPPGSSSGGGGGGFSGGGGGGGGGGGW